MLRARIQQEAGPRLDDRTHLEFFQAAAHTVEPLGAIGRAGRQGRMVEGDGHAAVTDFAQQRNGAEQIVMRQTVRVVAEDHVERIQRPRNVAGTMSTRIQNA